VIVYIKELYQFEKILNNFYLLNTPILDNKWEIRSMIIEGFDDINIRKCIKIINNYLDFYSSKEGFSQDYYRIFNIKSIYNLKEVISYNYNSLINIVTYIGVVLIDYVKLRSVLNSICKEGLLIMIIFIPMKGLLDKRIISSSLYVLNDSKLDYKPVKSIDGDTYLIENIFMKGLV